MTKARDLSKHRYSAGAALGNKRTSRSRRRAKIAKHQAEQLLVVRYQQCVQATDHVATERRALL